MKPLNADTPGCNPISSNCVIWQGPDIECIKLCKGDTISDVVYKLATELCAIMDQLDISNYDLSCLNLGTATPVDIQGLIQLLVNKICTLSGIDPTTPSSGGNQDIQVPIAECFYYTNPFGDLVTTMTIQEYVTAIGNTICNMVQQLGLDQSVIATHTTQITELQQTQDGQQAQIDNLTPVLITPQCVLSPNPTLVENVVMALEQQFCLLIGATGGPSDIYDAIAQQCSALSQSDTLGGGGGNMGSIPGWDNNITNLAASINNIWLTICDLRSAVRNIQVNCCPAACDDILVSLQSVLNGDTLTLYVSGTIPSGFATCDPSGVLITVSDSTGGSYTTRFNIVAFLNNPTGYILPLAGTPINTSANITITIDNCLTNASTSSTCQSVLQSTIINDTICPAMTYNQTTGSITYSGNIISGTATYTVELWNNAGDTLLSSQVQLLAGPAVLAGTFLGLSIATSYKLRVKVTVNSVDTYCPFTPVTTLTAACPAPAGISAAIII